MFAGKTLLQILSMGGFTMYILLLCSILSLGVILDRVASYWRKSRVKRPQFMEKIKNELRQKDLARAVEICRDTEAPFAKVVLAGLEKAGRTEKLVTGVMERQITVEVGKLERLTSIVATIGNIAVYIGLFGTVLGIIHAFRDISIAGNGGHGRGHRRRGRGSHHNCDRACGSGSFRGALQLPEPAHREIRERHGARLLGAVRPDCEVA